MCGIHGLYQLDGSPALTEWLARMGNVTTHRGPDDSGAHADGRCAIGMRRLSIIDLSGGHQPIANDDRSLVVVCNGEIYNYRELRRELQALGHRFSTESDSEVVLHGYAQWGERFVERLNGMFGFAHLGFARARRCWSAATASASSRSTGSRTAGAWRSPRRPRRCSSCLASAREVDAAALAAYLELGYVPAPLSMFRGIRKLPIGSILKVAPQGTSIHTYWQPPTAVDTSVERQRLGAARSRATRGIGAHADGQRRADRRVPVRRHRFQRGARLHVAAQLRGR